MRDDDDEQMFTIEGATNQDRLTSMCCHSSRPPAYLISSLAKEAKLMDVDFVLRQLNEISFIGSGVWIN